MASPSDSEPAGSSIADDSSLYGSMSEVILTGVAVIVPVVITVYVLQVAFAILKNALQPVVELLRMIGVIEFVRETGLVSLLLELGLYSDVGGALSELIAVAALVGLIVVVGTVASNPGGERLVGYVDVFIGAIPGVGTVYKSFRRMGDIVLDDEVENFQEVKLVELLGEGTYVIGFEVGHSPPEVREATDSNTVTMFVPFAPNPVTGGFLTYVSEDRLVDVDMTVEEGVRNVITSGVAGYESGDNEVEVTVDDLQQLLDREGSLTESVVEGTDGSGPDGDGGSAGGR